MSEKINWPLGSTNKDSKMQYVGWCKNVYCGKDITECDIKEFKKWLDDHDYPVVSFIR